MYSPMEGVVKRGGLLTKSIFTTILTPPSGLERLGRRLPAPSGGATHALRRAHRPSTAHAPPRAARAPRVRSAWTARRPCAVHATPAARRAACSTSPLEPTHSHPPRDIGRSLRAADVVETLAGSLPRLECQNSRQWRCHFREAADAEGPEPKRQAGSNSEPFAPMSARMSGRPEGSTSY